MDNVLTEEQAVKKYESAKEIFGRELPENIAKEIIKCFKSGRLDFNEIDEYFTITLVKEIPTGSGERLTFLTITEPDFLQVQKAGSAKTEIEQTSKLISLITGLPQGLIDRLKMRDVSLAGAVLSFFG